MRFKFGLFISILATVAAFSAEKAGAESPRFMVEFPLDQPIGPMRAGSLCLPKGAVRGTDLISDEAQFGLLVRHILEERKAQGQDLLGDGTRPEFELHLMAAKVRLCAKSWGMFGMGDTKSLSGKAAFTFAWKKGSQTARTIETIALEVSGKDRLTAQAILRRALSVLLERMAESEK